MKIKQFLMAAAAMMLAVACNDPVEPTPEPQPEFTPETWSVVGTNNGWDAAGAPAMAFENDYYVAQDVVFEENGAFKFVKDNAWTVSRSYAGEKPIRAGYYYAVQQRDGEGTDIFVEKPGKYDIYLNKTADKFYMMADGAVPADAQDGETIEVAPAAVAEIAIRESEMAENYIAFNLTTANVAAASYNVLPTEAVDETITAEVILSEEGGYALEAEELGTTVETGFRRGVQAGTEYTIFLAYEDLNGVKAMVTETVTTPGAAAVGGDVEFVATSYDFDPEWADMFIFIGEEYELVVCLDTQIQLDTDYSFADHITAVYFKDANGDQIDAVEAGSFSIYAAEGMHCATAEVVTASGNTVFAIYEGTINGLGGGAGGAGTFTVASAKFYHSSQDTVYETPVEDTRYCLEIVSTNQDFLFLVIDNYYPISAWGDETPFLNATCMSFYDPENPTSPYVNLELSFMMMYQITNFQFLMVQSAMPGSDMNLIQAMFTAGSHMNGSVVDFMVNHTEPIAMYTPLSWDNAPVITKDVTSYGADGWFVYGVSETYDGEPGAQYNFCDATYATDVYLSIYDFTQTAPITAVTPGFYPMISEATESGLLAKDVQAIMVDNSYYSLAMPESATDANGRHYGVTITVPTSIEAEDCVFEAYFTAVDYTTGAPVVFDIKYTGSLKGMF